jgi:pyrroloquinoline quinone (PQQ) biosynthesis protein C
MNDTTRLGRQKSSYLQRIETLLYAPDIEARIAEPPFRALPGELAGLAARCFEQESPADQQHVHEVLYAINVASLALPWEHAAVQVDHPFIVQIRHTLESAWDRAERRRHAAVLDALPPVAQFEQWVTQHIREHRCNVSHPLFRFLRDDATLDQLRLFFFQESPFDIFHADLITLMMPGVYGRMKEEMADNFNDEMGDGAGESAVHRTIRIETGRRLGLDTDAHIRQIHRFVSEELALSNMYFDGIRNRGKLVQGIGMMLATETMVPGRINHQIAGFRRNGMDGDQIYYLTLHAEVDVGHGANWMRNVVLPLLEAHPQAMREMMLGVERRLHQAGAVCDRMLTYLRDAEPAVAEVA